MSLSRTRFDGQVDLAEPASGAPRSLRRAELTGRRDGHTDTQQPRAVTSAAAGLAMADLAALIAAGELEVRIRYGLGLGHVVIAVPVQILCGDCAGGTVRCAVVM